MCGFLPLKSTHFIILHFKSTHILVFPLPMYTPSKMPFIWVFVWCRCFNVLATARNHTCAPLTTTNFITTHKTSLSPHLTIPHRPTKYHTWQFFRHFYHQQYRAIQEGHQRNNANKEGAKEGNRTTPKEVLCGNFGVWYTNCIRATCVTN
jgi:hypothetical protein